MATTITSVTIVYPDGTSWFAGQFPTQAEATAWIAQQQSQPNWVSGTQASQETITVPDPVQMTVGN